jgi:hypothetical protein
LLNTSIIVLLSCNEPAKNKTQGVDTPFTRQVENITFTFPAKSYAYENRDKLIKACLQAIKSNTALIKLDNYTDTINIQFLSSRQEMKTYTGLTVSGIAVLENKTIYMVVNGDPKEVNPPIKHELMHMISFSNWGYQGNDSNWLNEGLAALAENDCNGYDVEQIYRYLLDKNMLISMEKLAADFYKQPEMIAYHQSAYLVQYLLNTYGVEKLKDLWKHGFTAFEKIYNIPFLQIESDINNKVKQSFPLAPYIDWNIFQRGCF